MTTIYVLLDNNQIRYIGKTTKVDLNDKLAQHQLEAKSDPEKFGLISNLFREGKRLEIKPVIRYNDNESEHYEKVFLSDLRFFLGVTLTGSEAIKMQKLFQENVES